MVQGEHGRGRKVQRGAVLLGAVPFDDPKNSPLFSLLPPKFPTCFLLSGSLLVELGWCSLVRAPSPGAQVSAGHKMSQRAQTFIFEHSGLKKHHQKTTRRPPGAVRERAGQGEEGPGEGGPAEGVPAEGNLKAAHTQAHPETSALTPETSTHTHTHTPKSHPRKIWNQTHAHTHTRTRTQTQPQTQTQTQTQNWPKSSWPNTNKQLQLVVGRSRIGRSRGK